jgi:DNA-binding LacI/PurR family transcriptional regulator
MTEPSGRPTMEDVATRAGVSRSLVSLVMRGATNVSELRRTAVLQAAAELGYRPNAMARNLASRHPDTIGVMLSDLHNPYFAEIADSIETTARAAGLRIIINTGGRRVDVERQALEHLLEFRTAGLILVGSVIPAPAIEAAARSTPIVLVTRRTRSAGVDSIMIDEAAAGRLVIDHLAALGHERIAHIDGGPGAAASQRRRGYEQAMASAGLADQIRVVAGEYTEAAGEAGAAALFPAPGRSGPRSAAPGRSGPRSPAPGRSGPSSADPVRPTAVYGANDLVAAGVLAQLERDGLDVPRDVSVVGYDNTALAELGLLSLTTVDQPRAEMGRLAVQCLLERVGAERRRAIRHELPPALVVRRTTAPPPAVP